MSARMLKKLQGEADKLTPPPDDEIDNDHLTDNDELDTVRGSSHLNPFDLVSKCMHSYYTHIAVCYSQIWWFAVKSTESLRE